MRAASAVFPGALCRVQPLLILSLSGCADLDDTQRRALTGGLAPCKGAALGTERSVEY